MRRKYKLRRKCYFHPHCVRIIYNENASIKQLLVGLPRARTQHSQNHYNTSSTTFLFKCKGSIKQHVCGLLCWSVVVCRIVNLCFAVKGVRGMFLKEAHACVLSNIEQHSKYNYFCLSILVLYEHAPGKETYRLNAVQLWRRSCCMSTAKCVPRWSFQ